MGSRVEKKSPSAGGDLPFGVAATLVALCVVLVSLLSSRRPALPTALPPLTYDPLAVEREAAARTAALPPAWRESLAQWDALVDAQAGLARFRATHDRDAENVERSPEERGLVADVEQRVTAFSQVVQLATGRGDPGPMSALRAEARRRFLRAIEHDDPRWVPITSRHGLAGPETSVFATRAVRIAWFDYRWERFATPTPAAGGDIGGMIATLARIPPAEQRALVSWGLSARCGELLGVQHYPRVGDPTRCAGLRRDLIDAAGALDRTYPDSEARAAMDVLRAVAIRTLIAQTSNEDDADPMRAEAQHALLQAQERYALLLERHRTRRIERYLMGVVAATSNIGH